MTSSEWNVVRDGRTGGCAIAGAGGRRARTRGGIARGGPVLCFFGVSEFESSRGRGEKCFSFFFFFFGQDEFFLKEELGKKDFFV